MDSVDSADPTDDPTDDPIDDPSHLLELSNEQKNVVENIKFNECVYVVTACAGAGKTRTLSHIVVKALIHLKHVFDQRSTTRHGKLCLLTATRASKEEAMARVVALQEVLHKNKMDPGGRLRPENVRTIHSLALSILKDSVLRDSPNAVVQIVSQTDIRGMLLDLLAGVSLGRCSSHAAKDLFREIDVDEQANILSEIRTERLKQFVAVVQEENESLGPYAAFVLKQLELMLEGGHAVGGAKSDGEEEKEDGGEGAGGADHHSSSSPPTTPTAPTAPAAPAAPTAVVRGDFNSLIYGLASSKYPICGKGDILVVDEAQDLSLSQMEIVLTAAEHGASVVVLGDDSQGIMVFSGAVSRTLHALKREAEKRAIDVRSFKLLTNFRSTNQIVHVSEALLPFEDRRLRQGTRSNRDGKAVNISAWKNERAEAEAVAKKVLALIKEGECPGNIVVQRHSNFRYDDPVITFFDRFARDANLTAPKLILGSAATSASLTSKVLCALQILCGVDRFGYTLDDDDDGDGAFDTLQVFLRSIKGSQGCTTLAKKALVSIFRKHKMQTLFDLITFVDEDDGKALLEAELAVLLKAEAAEAALAETKVAAKSSSKRKRSAATGTAATEQALQKSITLKTSKFIKMLQNASFFTKEIASRFVDIACGETRISPIMSEFRAASRKQRVDAVGEWTAVPKNMSGLLVWMITRDVLDVKWSVDLASEFDVLMASLDVSMEGFGHDVAGALVTPISKVLGELNDKNMTGKVVFTTIHKFKGRERDVAFVMNLQEPFAKVKQSKASALFNFHDKECTNRHGRLRGCSCNEFLKRVAAMSAAEKDEKRRLHYVGASRARERLFLSTNIGKEVLNELASLRCEFAMDGRWAPVIFKR